MNKIFDKFKKDVILAPYTTFKIGGKADYFVEVENENDLIEAIKAAKGEGMDYFVLSGGSNILVSDNGFRGLVIKVKSLKSKVKNKVKSKKSEFFVVADAGVKLGDLVSYCLENGLVGVEFLTGIPGTVGGAIYGNAGAYGSEFKNILESVRFYDTKLDKIIEKKVGEIKFNYRWSEFKLDKNKIILSAELKLIKGKKNKIQAKINELIKSRQNKLPWEPSAGSVFKNIETNLVQIIDKLDTDKINKELFLERGKIPVAVLIEKCGLKGKIIGGAKISEKHANFIINFNDAKAKDVMDLVDLIKKEVKKKFGVDLELENILLGF